MEVVLNDSYTHEFDLPYRAIKRYCELTRNPFNVDRCDYDEYESFLRRIPRDHPALSEVVRQFKLNSKHHTPRLRIENIHNSTIDFEIKSSRNREYIRREDAAFFYAPYIPLTISSAGNVSLSVPNPTQTLQIGNLLNYKIYEDKNPTMPPVISVLKNRK